MIRLLDNSCLGRRCAITKIYKLFIIRCKLRDAGKNCAFSLKKKLWFCIFHNKKKKCCKSGRDLSMILDALEFPWVLTLGNLMELRKRSSVEGMEDFD